MTKQLFVFCLTLLACVMPARHASSAEGFPPGWLPIAQLDRTPAWPEVRKTDDRVHLYLPNGEAPVRGVPMM